MEVLRQFNGRPLAGQAEALAAHLRRGIVWHRFVARAPEKDSSPEDGYDTRWLLCYGYYGDYGRYGCYDCHCCYGYYNGHDGSTAVIVAVTRVATAPQVREKDGLWAVLAWLSILAHHNAETPVGSLVTVDDIVRQHWRTYGRNYYTRYDYEQVDAAKANEMVAQLLAYAASFNAEGFGPHNPKPLPGGFGLATVDEFSYTDPIDGSVSSRQGVRLLFADGSRIIFRLSGTGSVGATVRMYIEKYQVRYIRHTRYTRCIRCIRYTRCIRYLRYLRYLRYVEKYMGRAAASRTMEQTTHGHGHPHFMCGVVCHSWPSPALPKFDGAKSAFLPTSDLRPSLPCSGAGCA